MKFLRIIFFLGALVSLPALPLALKPLAAQSANSNGLRVIESNSQHLVLELVPPPHQTETRVVNTTTYLDLTVPAWDLSADAGKPRVPILGTLVALPQRANPRVNILEDETTRETLAHPLAPAPTLRADYASDATQPRPVLDIIPDAAAYSSEQLYPAERVEISAPAQWRSQRYLTLRVNPFQYNAARNELTVHTKLRIEITFNVAADANAKAFGVPVNEGAFESVFQNAFVNYSDSTSWRAPTVNPPALSQRSNVAAGSTAYKIAVDADGMYKITCADLSGAGIALAGLNLDTVQISNQGTELAIQVLDADHDKFCDSGDEIHFWGVNANSNYTDTNIYWLTYGGANGKRMSVRAGTGSGTIPGSYIANAHAEDNRNFISYLPWDENAEHWWWYAMPNQYDPDGNGAADSADFTLHLDNPTLAGNATLQVLLGAVSATNHHTKIFVNGNLEYEAAWSGVTTRMAEMTFAANLLHAGDNTVRVQELVAAPNYVWVNHLDLAYARTFTAVNNELRFAQTANGVWNYQIGGFTNASVNVFDITDPYNPAFVNASVAGSNPYTAQFTENVAAPRAYYALTNARWKSPVSITLDNSSHLASPNNGADYIIITHNKFKTNIQPLAAFRATQMRVAVVDVQDVYDEFNGGVFSPQALRDFLAYAYANWQAPKPAYVLLVGDGNFNFKNYATYANEANYIPPYMKLVDPWIGLTASDHRLVTLDANSPLPSIAIGRLPALTTSDVDGMVAKILNYEQNPPTGAWRSKVLFTADDPDQAGNFYALSNQVADSSYYMPSPMVGDKVYYPSGSNTEILNAINAGRLIVNYVGHSAYTAWAQNMLTSANASALTNGSKLPLMLPMTCYDGYFHFPGLASVSEALVSRAGGGAIASWAPTGLGVATRHDVLDRGFFEAVMQKNMRAFGAAVLYAKAKLYAEGGGADLLDTFNLFGDPATGLALNANLVTATPSNTPTRTPTSPQTATPTKMSTRTPTPTVTGTMTPTPTGTWSSPTLTKTATLTRTATASSTMAATGSPTATASFTPTPSATPLDCSNAPALPALIAPNNKKQLKKTKARLNWSVVDCAVKYQIQVRRDTKKGAFVAKKKVAAPPFALKNLEPGVTYFWHVRACNSASPAQCSKWTKSWKFSIKQ